MTRDRQPFFYGWWVALTAALGLFLGVAPIFVFSFSVFLKAFTQEFHATRAGISLAFTLHNLVSAFTAPFAGRLIDRCTWRPCEEGATFIQRVSDCDCYTPRKPAAR